MHYVFADCVLDTELATLHRAGRAITLRPKVFHLLHYLLEQREHLVTKDTLCAQIWPGQCISDAALEGCLKLARQAIGDSGRAQRLIQTRRGYGYRFIGAVEKQPAVHLGETGVEPGNALTPHAVAPPAPAPVREVGKQRRSWPTRYWKNICSGLLWRCTRRAPGVDSLAAVGNWEPYWRYSPG